MLSYLIHIKRRGKYQYDPEEVITITVKIIKRFSAVVPGEVAKDEQETAKTAKITQMNLKP